VLVAFFCAVIPRGRGATKDEGIRRKARGEQGERMQRMREIQQMDTKSAGNNRKATGNRGEMTGNGQERKMRKAGERLEMRRPMTVFQYKLEQTTEKQERKSRECNGRKSIG
jgi:hypothetical protein